jgi:UDP:flavonoid glycosyltransferase YjiC (YdhE family)
MSLAEQKMFSGPCCSTIANPNFPRIAISSLSRKHHLPVLTDSSQAWSPLAQICQHPAVLEYPRRELPGWFHFTGPLVDPASRAAVPFPCDAFNGKLLIYASLGTIQNQQLEVFPRIAEACAHLDAQLVIALGGGGIPEALPTLPGDPLVVGFAPQGSCCNAPPSPSPMPASTPCWSHSAAGCRWWGSRSPTTSPV